MTGSFNPVDVGGPAPRRGLGGDTGGSGRAWERGSWLILCVLVLAVITLANATLASHNVAGAYALVPFMASALATQRQTVIVAMATVAVAVTTVVIDDVGPAAAVVRLSAVVLSAALAVWVSRERIRRERRIVALTRVAEVAQKAILAPLPTVTGSLALASTYRSATDEASVGGDLIDVTETSAATFVVIGDVKGKGITAVALAAGTLRAFRDAVLTTSTLQDTVDAIDRRLAYQLDDEDFVTAAICRIGRDGVLDLVSCAHPPPLLLSGGAHRLLEPASHTTPFGLAPRPTPMRVQLVPGDRVLLYTDGLVEARAPDGSFVPLESLVDTLAGGTVDEALDGLMGRLRDAVAGRFTDDLALLLLEYLGDPATRPAMHSTKVSRV